jgi:hypothetical protein
MAQPLDLLQQVERQCHARQVHVEILVQPDGHLGAPHAVAGEAPARAISIRGIRAARLDHAFRHELDDELLAGVTDLAELLEAELQRFVQQLAHERVHLFACHGSAPHVPARIQISLEDAFRGASRTLELRAPEGGSRSIRVAIPRGVTEGQRIRLAGQGVAGMQGGAAGDLFLEISFTPHRIFEADGRNILLTLPVTPWEAALGETVAVPTLGGRVDLKIPAGSQSGRRLRLKGRGLPGSPAGDQIVTLSIETPPADSEDARRLYEEMRSKLPFDPRRDMGG